MGRRGKCRLEEGVDKGSNKRTGSRNNEKRANGQHDGKKGNHVPVPPVYESPIEFQDDAEPASKLPEHVKGVSFLRMNQLKTIENLRYSEGKGMDETPTMFIYCNGEYVESIVGYHPLEETVSLIDDVFNRHC